MDDVISRQAAIDAVNCKLKKWSLLYKEYCSGIGVKYSDVIEMLSELPSAEPEPLTDKEQRIFLAAMGREEKVCKEVDENLPLKEPYEDSLVQVCREIVRKVRGTLWR